MRVLFVAMSYVFPFSTVFRPCVPVIGRGQEGRGGGMRGSQNLPVCFLFPAFLKGINPWARCHYSRPGALSPCLCTDGKVQEGVREASQCSQVVLPPSCPGLISVSGDSVALALGPLRLWCLDWGCSLWWRLHKHLVPTGDWLGTTKLALHWAEGEAGEHNGFWVTMGFQIWNSKLVYNTNVSAGEWK